MNSHLSVTHVVLTIFFVNIHAEISNDIEFPNRNNLPKPVNYFTFPPSEDSSTQNSEKTPGARFTYPTGTTLEGYGSNVLSHGFYPLKFDVGGLLLGAVVGLGALLIIPKLIHLLVPELAAYGHTYGIGAPYGRNVDLPEGVNQIVSQFEKVLSENHINSSECMQKAICSYVQSSFNRKNRASTLDNNDIEDKPMSDNLIGFLIDGSKFKSAIENGKLDVGCSVLYPKCPFTQNSITSGIKQLLLNNVTFSGHR